MEEVKEEVKKDVKKSGSFFKKLGLFVILIVIIAAGFLLVKNQLSGVVAIVNGQEITRLTYDQRYNQLSTVIAAQGQSVKSEEIATAIKNQTLDNLINETLLLQAAAKENIKVDNKAVEDALAQNKAQFKDEADFQKALTEQGLNNTTFREFLVTNNIIQQYLKANIDFSTITVTSAEIKTFYDQAALTNKDLPPLAEVKAAIENQIVQQKQQTMIDDYLNKLRTDVKIEKLI